MPIAVAPTAAVLPIRQTSTQARPAGIDLRVPQAASPDAFHRALPASAPLPIAVPAYEGVVASPDAFNQPDPASVVRPVPGYEGVVASSDAFNSPAPPTAPMRVVLPPYELPDEGDQAYDGRGPAYDRVTAPPRAPVELAAPVTPTFDPAEWGVDIEAAPASGRRRGAEADTAPGTRRPKSSSAVRLPARLLGRGKAGAARLLVLALVVGAEGVAVTSMVGHARSVPVDPSTANITTAFQIADQAPNARPKAASATDTAEQQAAAAEAQTAAVALAKAQDEASKAKVTAGLQQAKAAADRVKAAEDRRARVLRNAQRDPRAVGRILAADRGWGADQFSCLNLLWNRESQWNYKAANPSSSAYGIPQALAAPGGAPGSKMASAGADWRTNPATQIKWGLDYIADRYGTPCGAWGHSQSTGWY